jgi:hypothetical protein
MEGNRSSARYGAYYFIVELTSGKDVSFHADQIRIEEGCLLAVQDKATARMKDGDVDHEGRAPQADRVTLAYAPGTWTRVYAASQLDGHAVVVDQEWDAPPPAAGELGSLG